MKIRSVALSCLVVCGLILTSCSIDDSPPPPAGVGNPTSYTGTFASGTESGWIALTVAAPSNFAKTAAVLAVAGTMKRTGGTSIALGGTLNTVNDSLVVNGGTPPDNYSFVGALSGRVLAGNYAGPAGDGSFTLSFSVNDAVRVFLGSYTSLVDSSSGNFNLVRDGTILRGLVLGSGSSQLQVNGITVGDSIRIYFPNTTSADIADGVFSNSADTSASGNYDTREGDHGTWSCKINR
jgi:hypothetical protein